MEYFQFECLKILQKQNMLQKVSNAFKILRFRKIAKIIIIPKKIEKVKNVNFWTKFS